jgi:hypothetical protein
MSKCTVCGGTNVSISVIPSYVADLLGAPFSVVLEHSVREESCASCGKKLATVIPDLEGLIQVVAQSRAMTPRKLTGPELKFLRSALGCKSKEVARKLELAPEHWSRCESGTKVLSPLAEKWFRLFVVLKATPKPKADHLLNFSKYMKTVDIDAIVDLKIESSWDEADPLVLRFFHRGMEESTPDRSNPPEQSEVTGIWEPEPIAA